MVAITMTFLIINGEIDLSAPSIMGLAACSPLPARSADFGTAPPRCRSACGMFNGFWILGGAELAGDDMAMLMSRTVGAGLPDKSISKFPEWFNWAKIAGAVPAGAVIFFGLLLLALIILQYSGFGRTVYVIGNNKDVAHFSGVQVPRVKFILYIVSGLVSALAGLLLAARLGAVRGDIGLGFELDIITMVLLGGVSIFGGSGSLYGVFLAILIILNIRNGMGLATFSGHFQTGVVGLLLILSVLGPNLANDVMAGLNRRRRARMPEQA
jgi:rhamnose transport system permease protein